MFPLTATTVRPNGGALTLVVTVSLQAIIATASATITSMFFRISISSL
jgi:hypothetical protein